MKLSSYHKILIVLGVLLFYLNVPLYVYENHGLNQIEAPKTWVFLFCVFSVPVLLRQMTPLNVVKSPVMFWCLGYAVLTVLWFFLSSQSELAWQEVRNRFLTVVQIIAFLMVFWEPAGTRLARKTVVAGVLIAVGFNIYELFAPRTFSEVPGRSAGLYMNPNMTAEALVLGMILSVTVLKSQYRAPFIFLAGIGIFLTLSRAGVVAWMIAVAGLLLLRGVSLRRFLHTGAVVLVVTVLFLVPRWDQFLTTWERSGVMNMGVMERLAWFTDPSGVSDHSSWERKYVAKQAWDRVAEQPFLGYGTGSFQHAAIAPHNQYLSFMLDHGLMGVLILPLLILAVTWGTRGESKHIAVLFGCVILMLSLFTHAILTVGYAMILLSLMAAMTVTSRNRESKRTVVMETEGDAAQALVRA